MSSIQYECCDGSFAHAFQGPVGGFVPMFLAVLSCAPVLIVMFKIARETQKFDCHDDEAGEVEMRGQGTTADSETQETQGGAMEESSLENSHGQVDEENEDVNAKAENNKGIERVHRRRYSLPAGLRIQLLVSGSAKLATRFYAGVYASAAAGSAHVCNPYADSVINVCLSEGYGFEAFVLGYSGIAAGILDWMTLVRTELPVSTSLSAIRWEVINGKRCACCESMVLGVLLFLLAIVGAGGHIWSARDSSGVILAVIIGIYVAVGAAAIICGLVPFVCCSVGVCRRVEGDEGYVLARSWETVRSAFLDLPGLIIGFFSTAAALTGWIIDAVDFGTDFFLDHRGGAE